jgi:hypothetical protein
MSLVEITNEPRPYAWGKTGWNRVRAREHSHRSTRSGVVAWSTPDLSEPCHWRGALGRPSGMANDTGKCALALAKGRAAFLTAPSVVSCSGQGELFIATTGTTLPEAEPRSST